MMLREGIVEDGYAAKDRVAWQLMGLCLTLCGYSPLARMPLCAGMRTKTKWSPGPGLKYGVSRSLMMTVGLFPLPDRRSAFCPDCGRRTRSRHGWSNRSLQDLPVQGKTVTVKLRLSRWRCAHQKCERQTFTDRLPTIASPYARRTRRVAEIVGLLGHSTGGRPGERLMRRLDMPVCDDIILRQLKRDAAVAHSNSTIRVVGIDDWSWRRSWRYGTMIVDLERHSVVDILDDRSVASASQWLERHPSVEIVSRDRCGLYAQAVREGAPQARQVADRFHLMQNLRVAIEEQMSLSGRATGPALLPDKDIGSAQVDLIQDDLHVDATHRRRVRHAHRQSRQTVFEMVHALRKEGLSCSEIARRTGYGRRSIAKWLTSTRHPTRRRAASKPTSPLYFEAFLSQSWRDGNRCGRHLFHDIKQRGDTGSFSNLERLLASRRRAERPGKDRRHLLQSYASTSPRRCRNTATGHVISPVVAAALCMKPRGMLTINQARKVDVLKQGSHEFAMMHRLAMRFRCILRGP